MTKMEARGRVVPNEVRLPRQRRTEPDNLLRQGGGGQIGERIVRDGSEGLCLRASGLLYSLCGGAFDHFEPRRVAYVQPFSASGLASSFSPSGCGRAFVKSLRVVIDGSLAHHSHMCPIAVTSIPTFASRDRTDNGLFIWPEMSGNEADERCL